MVSFSISCISITNFAVILIEFFFISRIFPFFSNIIEEDAIRGAKVKSAEFTTKKIAGLEITQRESYLSLLESVIRQNYDAYSKVAKEDHLKPITAYEVQKLAVGEEYKIFTNNKVVTMYRRGIDFTSFLKISTYNDVSIFFFRYGVPDGRNQREN